MSAGRGSESEKARTAGVRVAERAHAKPERFEDDGIQFQQHRLVVHNEDDGAQIVPSELGWPDEGFMRFAAPR
jgi:hypothetical protein